MIVEVIAVGTELLLGDVVNGNAATIGRVLAEHGFDAHHQVVVGDNAERIAATVRLALTRAGALIITGGIGPTQDDLTREALCTATGRTMAFSQEWAEVLRDRWARAGREMPASNLRQAEHPEGALLLPNRKGTAPGLVLEQEGRSIFILPGVPEEMTAMLREEVMPRLRAVGGESGVLVSRTVRTWGYPESRVGELLDDLYRASTNPSVAFLASAGEIKVRITAKAPTREAALKLIAPVEAAVRASLGASVFGIDDDQVEEIVLRMLGERGWTVGTAESATGGMVAARLTSVPGSSRVFRGAVVTYTTDLKVKLLGVEAAEGVISEPVAMEMAEGVRGLLDVDVAAAVTGSAGPEPLEREIGTMVIAVATPEATKVRTIRFPGDRERVRTYASTAALHLLRLAVGGQWWKE